MTAPISQTIDCRGQQCPGPILATARAVRELADSGGTLEVLADDAAFPLDLRSWCRSSGSELLSLTADGRGHRALVRIAQPSEPEVSVESLRVRVDCRSMECPQPILEVARAARREPNAELEVLADDEAFELDIVSWCRSARAELVELEREGGVFRARIRPGGAVGVAPAGSLPPVMAPSTPLASRPSADETARLDLGVIPEERRVAELDRTAADTSITRLVVMSPDRRFNARLAQWCVDGEHELVSLSGSGPVLAEIELAGRARPSPSHAIVPVGADLPARVGPKEATLLVLHNDKEALLAAMLVANGAAAQGMNVTVFFTFWGLNLLRGDLPNPVHAHQRVTWAQRLFKWLMPRGPRRQSLGKLNFGGMGSGMLNQLMRQKKIMDLPELLEAAQEQRVRFIACTMSMDVMGITKRDLHPYETLEYGGVATFVESAQAADLSLVF